MSEAPSREVILRGLEALAEGLRQDRPGWVIAVSLPDDVDPLLDRPTASANGDVVDHCA